MLCCAMRLPYRLAICDTTRSDIIMALCCTKKLDGMSALRLLRNLKIHERFLSTSLPRFAEGSDDGGPPPTFMPPPKPVVIDKTLTESNLRKFLSPEFIPPRQRTDPFKFFMERKDMIMRRKVLNIPEFYAGSILAVNMADAHASGKTNRFVGICTRRSGNGLGCTFVLRNIINGQGVEICYELYSPRIQQIDVLKLEKRLDDDIMYLRDALPEYSTVDPDMKPVDINPIGEVHINKLKVKMRPKPWSKRWERPKFKIQGINFALALTPEQMEHAQKWARPWVEYDFLREYDTSKLEVDILKEVQQEETNK